MFLVWGLLSAIPALLIWGRTSNLSMGVAAWFFLMSQWWLWFFWATAAPLNMVLLPELFVFWVIWWTWRCFYMTPPQRRPMRQIILTGPSASSSWQIAWNDFWHGKISPWLAALLLVGVCSYLAMAWLNGARSPYEEQTPSVDAADGQRNSKNPYLQQNGGSVPPQARDDLKDWDTYVRP
jgi:hypothetical protein